MPPWMNRPTITVTMYMPSCLATISKSAMEMIFPQMRQAIPKGEYLRRDKAMYVGYGFICLLVCFEVFWIHWGGMVRRCRYACGGQHLPHNYADEPHDNLVQDVEKLQHHFGLFSHFAHNYSESDKESNQTCRDTAMLCYAWINVCVCVCKNKKLLKTGWCRKRSGDEKKRQFN